LIQRDEAVRERNLADQRTTTAERTVDFVESMFKVSDPSEARGASVTALEILDRGAQQIQAGLDNEPAVKAQLGVTLGEVYDSLGLYKEGDQLIRQTLSLNHGQSDITALQLLALAASEEKLGEYDDAIASNRRVLDLAGRSPAVGPDLEARALAQLAQAQADNGDDASAASSASAALRLDQARSPPEAADVSRDLEVLGDVEQAQQAWSSAQPHFAQALALRRQSEGRSAPASPTTSVRSATSPMRRPISRRRRTTIAE
jgi:tetratricopeptide (TPR) repeat protein